MNIRQLKWQKGASLMEVLVAMSISLVVTASMVALMANSLGSTTRIIKMTKLSDDMRIALQMMTRDVRRSSFTASAMLCYGNDNCDDGGGPVEFAGDVEIVDGNCFWFETDRGGDGSATNDEAGGFRLMTRTVGEEQLGWIEMYTGATQPTCTEAAGSDGWVAVTDPDSMNITAFSVDDDLSYTEVVLQSASRTVSQKVRKIRMDLQGELVMDPSINRQMQDIISVRNGQLIIVEAT